jgi:hypothetical protein
MAIAVEETPMRCDLSLAFSGRRDLAELTVARIRERFHTFAMSVALSVAARESHLNRYASSAQIHRIDVP